MTEQERVELERAAERAGVYGDLSARIAAGCLIVAVLCMLALIFII